ncbi:mycofactocin biosynthesis peptidyl-dipeptidase MftE [Nocardioides sp. YIM 152588]|uniref:mycofactocin biosynthesis peptidyl-dipeptidase MftE n=1 Tax=Nocardioides sp. YIM 152588 TaxID=3158259 RepID=UPI0032E4886E
MIRHAPTLASATSTVVEEEACVLVPVGAVEQHGPHLPLDTDSVIAAAVAAGAATELADRGHRVLVAPALSYGASGEHQDFAGTSSIGSQALRVVLVELTRSMRTWARRVVFVNAHGGNVAALRSVVAQLTEEGHDVDWVPCVTEGEGDLHAGRTETSLMLHLHPWDVRMSRAEAGNTGTLEELLPLMREGGVKAVSHNGVLGDPTGASAGEGRWLLAALVRDVVARVAEAEPRWERLEP